MIFYKRKMLRIVNSATVITVRKAKKFPNLCHVKRPNEAFTSTSYLLSLTLSSYLSSKIFNSRLFQFLNLSLSQHLFSVLFWVNSCLRPTSLCLNPSLYIFSRVLATLQPALSVRPSVRPSVTLYFFVL